MSHLVPAIHLRNPSQSCGPAVYGSLNMVLGYIIRNNSDVDPNSEKTDTIASISLEYTF